MKKVSLLTFLAISMTAASPGAQGDAHLDPFFVGSGGGQGGINGAMGRTEPVDFTGMNARWRLSGPELSFFDAVLSDADTSDPFITASEVSVGVGLLRLLSDRELVVDRVSLSGTEITLGQDEQGEAYLSDSFGQIYELARAE